MELRCPISERKKNNFSGSGKDPCGISKESRNLEIESSEASS